METALRLGVVVVSRGGEVEDRVDHQEAADRHQKTTTATGGGHQVRDLLLVDQ